MNDIELLVEPFRSSVKEMIKRCKDIPGFRITETLRTLERQKELYKNGYSKTLKSKHLTGEACDVYVRDYDMSFYNQIYERIKDIPYIIWPYKDLAWNWDGPHFQYEPKKKENNMLTLDDLKNRVYTYDGHVYIDLNDAWTGSKVALGWDTLQQRLPVQDKIEDLERLDAALSERVKNLTEEIENRDNQIAQLEAREENMRVNSEDITELKIQFKELEEKLKESEPSKSEIQKQLGECSKKLATVPVVETSTWTAEPAEPVEPKKSVIEIILNWIAKR